jgi:signal peptide peptidase SppA
MGAIPIHHTATDTKSSWDGPAEVAAAPNDAKVLRYMHAWVDGKAPDTLKSAYKFPHHKNGTDTAANIHGVNNALARISQSDIPEGDKAGVEDHLRAHRKDAGLNAKMSQEEILSAVRHIAKSEDLTAEEKRGLIQAVMEQEGCASATQVADMPDGSSSPDGDASRTPLRAKKKGIEISMKKPYVLRAFMQTPWAILPAKLAILEEIVIRHAEGEKLEAEEVQALIHGADRPPEQLVNNVAVLPLFGTIFPRANLMTNVSGATSAERFGAQFAELVDDPEIGAIVLDVDSPGGDAQGIEEISQQIYDARGKKPIIAVANHTMASAAYWIGTAADQVVVTPSGEVGSIGVFAVHEDISKALENDGVKMTVIKAGKYKAEGIPYEPLSDEARAFYQAQVSDVYDKFVNAVARNRGVDAGTVKDDFGEGRMISAQQAVELGMADRIGTLDETIAQLAGPQNDAAVSAQEQQPSLKYSSVSKPGDAEAADAEKQREVESLREEIQKYL